MRVGVFGLAKLDEVSDHLQALAHHSLIEGGGIRPLASDDTIKGLQKTGCIRWVVADHRDVFVIFPGMARPVIGAGDNCPLIDNTELVVHQGGVVTARNDAMDRTAQLNQRIIGRRFRRSIDLIIGNGNLNRYAMSRTVPEGSQNFSIGEPGNGGDDGVLSASELIEQHRMDVFKMRRDFRIHGGLVLITPLVNSLLRLLCMRDELICSGSKSAP